LGYKAHQPTAYTFLRRYLRWTGWTQESFSLANYLIELATIHCFALEFRPQTIAAAAAVLSRQYVAQAARRPQTDGWKRRLLRCAHVDLLKELAPCTHALAQLHAAQHNQPDLFVNRKYSLARFHAVVRIVAIPAPTPAFYAQYMVAEDVP